MKKCGLVLLAVLLVVASGTAVCAATVKWRLVTHAAPGTEQQRIAEVFCDTVKTLSGGEFVIQPFPAGVLFPVFETFDSLRMGVVEASMVYGAYWPGKDPGFILQTRPGCPLSTYAEGAYLDEKLFPYFENLYGKYDMQYLGHLMESPLYEQLFSVVPINTLEDIKGLRIRTSGFGARYYGALGATTVSLSSPEIYTALQTKNIDAAEWTFWDENMRMGFHEVSNYVLDPAFQNGTCEYFPLVVNKAKWEALPQNFKDIVLAARDRARYLSAMVYVHEIKAREKWKALPNLEVITWSEEDQKKARAVGQQLVYEECMKTPEGQEYLEIYRNVLWELGYRDEAKNLGYEE
jgi:TRAP-type mannitol/chloroaromatic compound transport system substrate-binding protein